MLYGRALKASTLLFSNLYNLADVTISKSGIRSLQLSHTSESRVRKAVGLLLNQNQVNQETDQDTNLRAWVDGKCKDLLILDLGQASNLLDRAKLHIITCLVKLSQRGKTVQDGLMSR